MKKTKLINSIMLGSLGISIPTSLVLLTSCSSNRIGVDLVYGDKDILYTNRTKSVVLKFKARDAKDCTEKLKIKITNVVISGAEASPVQGLIKSQYDSGGNIVVRVYPQMFKTQWPDATTIEFSISFTNKETKLNQVMDGFKLTPFDITQEYEMSAAKFNIMETPVHDVETGKVYVYTCKFPPEISDAEIKVRIWKYFSFLKSADDSLLKLDYININVGGSSLDPTTDFSYKDDNTYIELANGKEPKAGEEWIFEVVYAESGNGRFANTARGSCLNMTEGVVNGFKTDTTKFPQEAIEEEFPNNKLSFYDHTTEIATDAFNNQTCARPIMNYFTTVSFEDCINPITIGEAAFAETKFTTLVLPTTLKEVKHMAFAKSAITGDLVIPSLTQTIESMAFNHCEEITSVTIPSSCTTIGNGAFSYMTKLAVIDFSAWASVPTISSTSIFEESGAKIASSGTIKIKQGSASEANWWVWLKKQGLNPEYWTIQEVA